jgi:hypothetical protein
VATLLEVAAAQSVLALALLKRQQAERRGASKVGAPDTWLTATQADEVAQLSPRFFLSPLDLQLRALLSPRAQQQRAHVRPAREPSITAHRALERPDISAGPCDNDQRPNCGRWSFDRAAPSWRGSALILLAIRISDGS